MKYALKNNCIYKLNETRIQIVDLSDRNMFELTDLMRELFIYLFINNKSDDFALNQLMQKNFSPLQARRELNKLIYPLYNHKFISCRNNKTIGHNCLYIHSCLLEITNVCNFRCPHCYVDKKNAKYLPFEDVKVFADELYELNCNSITLTGGEVFTHFEFNKIYEYLYKKGFLISINTNSSLINDEVIELFKKMPPNIVEISLYGYDEETYYNFTHCKNCYANIITNIKKLQDIGIDVKLKNVITNANKKFFDKIKEVAHSNGCLFRSDYISFPQINNDNNQKLNPEQISVENVMEYLSNYKSCEEYYLRLFSTAGHTRKVFKCKQKDDNFFMNVDKQISICLCMQSDSLQYQYGQLSNVLLALRRFKSLKYRRNAKCRNCKYISLCRYCPGKFKMSTQDFQTPPEWFCDLGQSIYKKYVDGFHMIRKCYLNNKELSKIFGIVSNNMKKLGFEISAKDETVWKENLQRNLTDEKFYFYVIYQNGEIVGFVEVGVFEDKLFLSELQLCDNAKNTRVLPNILNRLVELDELANFDKIYFKINKNNIKSQKTFEHLGAVKNAENSNSYSYVLGKNNVKKYLKKIKR